jgi:hypothetical protein
MLKLCAKSVKCAGTVLKASDDPEEDETQREIVIESFKADCGVRRGRS